MERKAGFELFAAGRGNDQVRESVGSQGCRGRERLNRGYVPDVADGAVVAGLRLVIEMNWTGEDESEREEAQEGQDPVEAPPSAHTHSSNLNTQLTIRSQAGIGSKAKPGAFDSWRLARVSITLAFGMFLTLRPSPD
jgi:hypothetical protein